MMKLDRNINKSGKGKYAVINLRKIPSDPRNAEELANAIKSNPECVEFGVVGEKDEFWLIKLRDRFAKDALIAYADATALFDLEYSEAVREIAFRSGINNPFCKDPD